MTDDELRALAVKMLKHAAADDAVASVLATAPIVRGEPKVEPIVTAEERALLNMLGGVTAGAMESRVVSLASQGCSCGCGCGCGCGDGDGDGDGGDDDGDDDDGEGDEGEANASGGEDSDSAAAADAAAAAADAAAADAESAAAEAAGASMSASMAADNAAAADAESAAAEAAGASMSAATASAAETAGDPSTTENAADAPSENAVNATATFSSWSAMAEALGFTEAAPTESKGFSSLGIADESNLSQSTKDAMEAADKAESDPGISAASYGALANQNAEADATLNAVSAGLDATAADQGNGGSGLSSVGSVLGELFGVGSAKAGELGWMGWEGPAKTYSPVVQAPQFVAPPPFTTEAPGVPADMIGPTQAAKDMVADQAKADQAKADQAKADQDKADQAKADQDKADQAKADQAKADQDKADEAKAKEDEAKAQLTFDLPTITTPEEVVTEEDPGPVSDLGRLDNEKASPLTDAERDALAQQQLAEAKAAEDPLDNEKASPLTDQQRADLAQQQLTDASKQESQNVQDGLSKDSLDALAAQNEQASQTLAAISAGLDANATQTTTSTGASTTTDTGASTGDTGSGNTDTLPIGDGTNTLPGGGDSTTTTTPSGFYYGFYNTSPVLKARVAPSDYALSPVTGAAASAPDTGFYPFAFPTTARTPPAQMAYTAPTPPTVAAATPAESTIQDVYPLFDTKL